jgi:hypothetical protein
LLGGKDTLSVQGVFEVLIGQAVFAVLDVFSNGLSIMKR